jgi:hypothetical protein
MGRWAGVPARHARVQDDPPVVGHRVSDVRRPPPTTTADDDDDDDG